MAQAKGEASWRLKENVFAVVIRSPLPLRRWVSGMDIVCSCHNQPGSKLGNNRTPLERLFRRFDLRDPPET
jgi:hypothetical protein